MKRKHGGHGIAVAVAIATLALPGCGGGEPELSPALAQGKAIVERTCFACHGQGINGAPIIGNRKMWGPRIEQGIDTLVEHAINGFAMQAMPARGGNPQLSDADIRAAVTYMVSQVNDKP